MSRWVVTGANRGIGLEMARQLSARGDTVVALARDPARGDELAKLAAASAGRVNVHRCDVRDDAQVRAAAAAAGGHAGNQAVDFLVNNAGVMGKMTSLEDLDTADAMASFDANALGPLRVARAFLPLMMRSKFRRIVCITSGMGSIGDNRSGGAYGYRMSKAALNMAVRSMAADLAGREFVCVVMNPGWVQTEMGGAGAPTPVEESVSKMLAIIDRLSAADSGTFLDYKGGTFEW